MLAGLAEQGITPKCALEVTVEKAFFHCAKSLLRSKLWDASTQVSKSSFATMGRLMKEHSKVGMDLAELEQVIEKEYKENL